MNRTQGRCLKSAALIVCMLATPVAAQDVRPDPAQGPGSEAADPDDPEFGFPVEHRPVGVPGDAEKDLNASFPKRDSVFSGLRYPRGLGIEQGREELYEKFGLKVELSYQLLYQYASEIAPFGNNDTALGQWWGFTSKWTPLRRGKSYEGSLVLTANDRNAIGGKAVPAQFGAVDLGSSWSNFEFTQWDFSIEDLYWEQWLELDRFFMRIGNQIPTTIYNSFRFKDGRTSYTSSPFAFHESIPYPTYGLGLAAKWWPVEDSELYVVGTLNDMNGDPNGQGLDWSTFGRGEYFYGIEIGYNWKRENGEFDHLHLDVFYADERSTRSPDTLPNEAGGGFKLLGSKQRGQFVGYGSYTFNTAEGGGISVTFARHTATAGVSYVKPFGIQGEASLGFMWMQTHDDLTVGPVVLDEQNQYGVEIYWKILLTPNMWVTPGLQVVFDPAFNPSSDVIAIPHIKFRIWL